MGISLRWKISLKAHFYQPPGRSDWYLLVTRVVRVLCWGGSRETISMSLESHLWDPQAAYLTWITFNASYQYEDQSRQYSPSYCLCRTESACTILSYFNECCVGRKDLMVNQTQLANISKLQAHLTGNYSSGKRPGQNYHIYSPFHISRCQVRKSTRYLLKYWSQSTSFAHDCFESTAVAVLIQNQWLVNYFLFFLCIADIHKVILCHSLLRHKEANNLLQEAL